MTAFEMGATEVTLSLYETVMGQTPEEVSSENLPVGNVSWYEAVEFCNKLSYLEELEPAYRIEGDSVVWDLSSDGYRLPTEAEWVYAASLGSDTAYSGSDNIEKVAWYLDNTNGRKRGVALLLPNASGLYDMSGNMWEWCWDGYSESPFTSRSGPVNAPADRYRVARGGSFENSGHKACKVSHRNRFDAGVRYIDVGFRVVRVKE
jgi:formylglycine-generating enzyme required for sulfatase activity